MRRLGVPHICIDLMVGLPGQTMKHWCDTIDAFLDLKLESVSIYTFFLIPDDVLAGNIQRGVTLPLPSPADTEAMFEEGAGPAATAETEKKSEAEEE